MTNDLITKLCNLLDPAKIPIETATKHVLQTSYGVTFTLFFDETQGRTDLYWSPSKAAAEAAASKKKARQILDQFEPWRNAIISKWSLRSGECLLAPNLPWDGQASVTIIDGTRLPQADAFLHRLRGPKSPCSLQTCNTSETGAVIKC